MSRPRIEMTGKDIRQIETLASLGMSQAEIATVLEISERTFRNKKATDDAIFTAYTRGRAKLRASVGAVALRNALEGNQRAIEWYEATRLV